MRTLSILFILLTVSSCVVYDAFDMCETLRKGDEMRFSYPPTAYPVKKETHLPTKCREFYNDGTARWAECMQVGPR